jgi:hypothetical protein
MTLLSRVAEALVLQGSPVEGLKSGAHLRIPWIGPLTTTHTTATPSARATRLGQSHF